MLKDNTVIVIDNSNYKSEYAEGVPFKAIVIDKDDIIITVRSLSTNKEYELYFHQVLESMEIEETKKLINLSNY